MVDLDAKLKRAAQRRLMAVEELERARVELAEVIREAAAAGVRQRDIVAETGYTREQVRRIVAGVQC
jgi:hypothetical protein